MPIPVAAPQLQLVNTDRAQSGLAPLAWSPCLAAVAIDNAQRIARQRYLSHTDGPAQDLRCSLGLRAGENIAYRSAGSDDQAANLMFMQSPEHRANILGTFRYLGAAWALNPDGTAFIAVEFG